jgi:hypothetical protein
VSARARAHTPKCGLLYGKYQRADKFPSKQTGMWLSIPVCFEFQGEVS